MNPDYDNLAARLKLLAHPERLHIVDVLRHETACVCHLEALLGKPQPYVSQQLRTLRHAGLITDAKRGLNVYYRLADNDVRALLEKLLGPVRDASEAMRLPLPTCVCPRCQAARAALEAEVARGGGK